MEDFRSKSYADSRMQIQPYNGPGSGPRPGPGYDFRSYSTSSYSYDTNNPGLNPAQLDFNNEAKFKKGKSTGGSTLGRNWSLSDPELQRKKRVASYKAYSVEGKVKGGFKKSVRWLKDRYNLVLHGWR